MEFPRMLHRPSGEKLIVASAESCADALAEGWYLHAGPAPMPIPAPEPEPEPFPLDQWPEISEAAIAVVDDPPADPQPVPIDLASKLSRAWKSLKTH